VAGEGIFHFSFLIFHFAFRTAGALPMEIIENEKWEILPSALLPTAYCLCPHSLFDNRAVSATPDSSLSTHH
jgi:hypothetical protein